MTHEEIVTLVIEGLREIKPPEALPDEMSGSTVLFAGDDPVTGDHVVDFDSLDALDLITFLEDRLQATVYDDIDLSGIRAVDDVAAFVLAYVSR